MDNQERRAEKKSEFLERLHNPTQLRVFLAAVVLAIGYAAIYTPFDNNITATKRKLEKSRKLLGLADDVGQLRKQFQQVESRLTKQTDSNEWVQYVLTAIRQSPLRLDSFSPEAGPSLGPYQIVILKVKLSGSYAELDDFLHWLDSNERLFRIDNVRMAPVSRDGDDAVSLDIMVLGLMG